MISKNFDFSGINGLSAFDVGKISSHIRRGTKKDYTNQTQISRQVVRSVIACCADLMEQSGCKNFEEFKEMLTQIECRENTSDSEMSSDNYAEMYGDYGFDPVKNNLDEILKKIGERGELLAVELLKNQYGENEVTFCNTDEKKQQGYDIVA